MKKIAAIIMVLALTFAFTGCMPSANTTNAVAKDELVLPTKRVESEESGKEEMVLDLPEIKKMDYDHTIEGLCKYLEDNYAVVGEKVQTSYDVIGAMDGYRYYFKFNKSVVQVEVYDFMLKDLKELGDPGYETKKHVKETGKLKVIDKEIEAYTGHLGDFVMIYKDESTDEKNQEQKERVIEIFKAFDVGNK